MALDAVISVSFLCHVWLSINIVQKLLLNDRDYVYNCAVAERYRDFTPAMQQTCQKQFNKETQYDLSRI
jgi:hypothetical protein